MDAPTIRIGSAAATLEVPGDLVCLALSVAGDDIAEQVALNAAALAVCWPANVAWPTRNRPRAWRVGQDLRAFGAAVYDDLRRDTRATVPLAELQGALREARGWVMRNLLTEDEVKAAEDFCAAPEGG